MYEEDSRARSIGKEPLLTNSLHGPFSGPIELAIKCTYIHFEIQCLEKNVASSVKIETNIVVL